MLEDVPILDPGPGQALIRMGGGGTLPLSFGTVPYGTSVVATLLP